MLGEYQPRWLVNGKKEPVGEPIPGYYPAVMDEGVFEQVQPRGKKFAGRVGHNISNLFSGLIFDGHTGATMYYTNKGKKDRNDQEWKYLYSDYRRTHPESKGFSWNYGKLEKLLLEYLFKLDWASLVRRPDENEKAVVSRLAELQGKRRVVEAKLERLAEAQATTDERPQVVLAKIKELEGQKGELEKLMEAAEKSVDASKGAEREMTRDVEKFF